MANMHVLTGEGGRWRVVMHFAVPGGSNSAGVPWPTAVVNSGVGGSTVLSEGDGTAGTITATEQAAILAGTILEHVGTFLVESDGVSVGKVRAALREFYAVEKSRVQTILQRQLRYFGATESEA